MLPRAPQSVAADFRNVLAYLQQRGIVGPAPPKALLDSAKRIHRATYSLILWRFRLKHVPKHGRVFIEEIASDALQILPQALMGYNKTTKLLTRGIVENTLRHLYFSDHPIEFARMNRDRKWYLTFEGLLDYVKIHPVFIETEPKFGVVDRLGCLYSDLSAGVHGRTVRDLEMRVSLARIAYSDTAAKKEAKLLERCAESTNFLLAMFHREQMRAFDAEDRSIILRTMSAPARAVWTLDS